MGKSRLLRTKASQPSLPCFPLGMRIWYEKLKPCRSVDFPLKFKCFTHFCTFCNPVVFTFTWLFKNYFNELLSHCMNDMGEILNCSYFLFGNKALLYVHVSEKGSRLYDSYTLTSLRYFETWGDRQGPQISRGIFISQH